MSPARAWHALWDYFFGFTVFRIYKGDISWSVSPGWSAKARENVPYSMAFLTMANAIATGVNPGAPGWKNLE